MRKISDVVLTLREDFEKRLGIVGENSLGEDNRCWKGYEPVPGKKAYEKGSCRKIQEHEHAPSYMNRSSLEAIKANVEFLLNAITDDTPVDNWAEDHIATAAHDLSQVADYMRGQDGTKQQETVGTQNSALPIVRKSLG